MKAELAELKASNERLTRWVDASRVVADPGEDPEEFLQSAQVMMREVLGLSEAETRQRIRALKAGMAQGNDDPEERAPRRGQRDLDREEMADLEERLAANNAKQVRELEKRLEGIEGKRIREDFQDTLEESLDNHAGMRTLLTMAEEAGRDPKKLAVILKKDMAREMKEVLASRWKKSRSWDDSWIPDAAKRACDQVHSKYKTMIEALSVDAGRSGGPDGEMAFLKETPPRKAPTERTFLEKGREEANRELGDWAVDALNRAGLENRTRSRV